MDDPFVFDVYLYEYKTYESLFKKAGFKSFELLETNEYKGGSASSKEEQEMFREFITYKHQQHHVFIAEK